jgi:biopolymer transport protein ExbB
MRPRSVSLRVLLPVVLLAWFIVGPLRAQPAPGGSAVVPSVTAPGVGAAPPSSSVVPAYRPAIGLVEWFRRGGVFMWPLLACSVIGLAAVIERWITLRRAATDTRRFIARVVEDLRRDGVGAAIETCKRTRGPVAAILHTGLLKADQGPSAVEKAIEAAGSIEVSFLQRGLIVMATVANVAPLLGFLGTVSGMIHAFDAIAAADQVSPKLVASGISEALITTEAGLCIAIPVQAFHNYFVSRIDRFIVEMEESALDLVDEIERRPGRS